MRTPSALERERAEAEVLYQVMKSRMQNAELPFNAKHGDLVKQNYSSRQKIKIEGERSY